MSRHYSRRNDRNERNSGAFPSRLSQLWVRRPLPDLQRELNEETTGWSVTTLLTLNWTLLRFSVQQTYRMRNIEFTLSGPQTDTAALQNYCCLRLKPHLWRSPSICCQCPDITGQRSVWSNNVIQSHRLSNNWVIRKLTCSAACVWTKSWRWNAAGI